MGESRLGKHVLISSQFKRACIVTTIVCLESNEFKAPCSHETMSPAIFPLKIFPPYCLD